MAALTQEQEAEIIESVLNACVQRYATEDARMFPVFDRVRGHFLVVEEGWLGAKRLYNPFVHVERREDTIAILQDLTNEGIANDLVRAGIAPWCLSLEYRPPALRSEVEFEAELAESQRQARPSRPGVIGRTRPDFLVTMVGIHANSPGFAEMMQEVEAEREREREEARRSLAEDAAVWFSQTE